MISGKQTLKLTVFVFSGNGFFTVFGKKKEKKVFFRIIKGNEKFFA